MKYSFIFVCQQGELEIKSMLLAASLKQKLKCEYQLIAAIPTPKRLWGKPGKSTINFLEKLGVTLIPIMNHIDYAYPIGNKLSCLQIETSGDIKVFIDSDMLCLGEFSHSPEFEAPFLAKPADGVTWGSEDGQWEKAYGIFGMKMPDERMEATVSKQITPPYFNAGFIAVRSDIRLGETWLQCCQSIDAHPDIRNKRPWLDQIGLPVALARLGIDYACLDERFNYPCHLKMLNPDNLPVFAHYHDLKSLAKEPVLLNHAKHAAGKGSELHGLLNGPEEWDRLPSIYNPSRLVTTLRGMLAKTPLVRKS